VTSDHRSLLEKLGHPPSTTPLTSTGFAQQDALILLVEDRQDDVLLMLQSFDRAGITNPIHVVPDGEEAIQYLGGTGKYSDKTCPLPELVLLDLKLPKSDGFEVLQWIRTNSRLNGLRVVVLTSSDDIRDVNLAYSLGANSFLVKPMDFSRLIELSSFISDTWLSTNIQTPASFDDQCAPKNKKVLLRDRASNRFYAGRSTWIREKHCALDFLRIELAEAAATAERLQGVEIVLAFEQPACELTLPLAFPGVRRY
jgi:CheY-like chemotaxis protein